MNFDIKIKITNKYKRLSWNKRLVISLSIFSVILSALSCYFFWQIKSGSETKAIIEKGVILSKSISNYNFPHLLNSDLDKLSIEKAASEAGVESVLLLDAKGSVLLPIELSGLKLKKGNSFIQNKEDTISTLADNNTVKVKKLITRSRNNNDLLGIVYLELIKRITFPFAESIIFSLILCLLSIFLYVRFKKDTLHALDSSADSTLADSDLSLKINNKMDELRTGLIYDFQHEWSRFVHCSGLPCAVLDAEFRICEMNSRFKILIGQDLSCLENSHILDVITDQNHLLLINDAIENISDGYCGKKILNKEKMGCFIFRMRCEEYNFRYILLIEYVL